MKMMVWVVLLVFGSWFWFRLTMDLLEQHRGRGMLYLWTNIWLSIAVAGVWSLVLALAFPPL